MKPMPILLAMALLVPAAASDRYGESRKGPLKEDARKAKPAAVPSRDAEARLKALEKENLRLRQELATKGGAAASAAGAESATPEGALAELQSGNARFVAGTRTRSQMGFNDAVLRQTLAKGQSPFAVIVTCSDSRLADNYIFDQELGRLFTIREAGNAPDIQGLASIEYAVEHLGSKVVVVMGHDACGAVKAVRESGAALLPGNLWSLQAAMAGLLDSAPRKAGESEAQHMAHLVEANAVRQAGIVMARSSIVQHLCASGKLKVVPAIYDLATGKVVFLPEVAPVSAKAEAHH